MHNDFTPFMGAISILYPQDFYIFVKWVRYDETNPFALETSNEKTLLGLMHHCIARCLLDSI